MASASHSRALAVAGSARPGEPAGRQRRAGLPDIQVSPGEFLKIIGQLVRLAAAGRAGHPLGQPGKAGQQRPLRLAAERPRPESGRRAAAEAEPGRTALGRQRIGMRKTDRVKGICENILNGLPGVDRGHPAGRDPGECIADGIGAGEGDGGGHRARTRPAAGRRPDHPFRIGVNGDVRAGGRASRPASTAVSLRCACAQVGAAARSASGGALTGWPRRPSLRAQAGPAWLTRTASPASASAVTVTVR